jgi:hypothetical protein
MPDAPALSTVITQGSTGHINDTNTVHAVVNNIYKVPIAATRTASFTVSQLNSGEFIPINSTGAVTVTVPVLEQGTSVELYRQGSGTISLNASGVTFEYPSGSSPTPRVQGTSITLLWRTTAIVVVGGDLT